MVSEKGKNSARRKVRGRALIRKNQEWLGNLHARIKHLPWVDSTLSVQVARIFMSLNVMSLLMYTKSGKMVFIQEKVGEFDLVLVATLLWISKVILTPWTFLIICFFRNYFASQNCNFFWHRKKSGGNSEKVGKSRKHWKLN